VQFSNPQLTFDANTQVWFSLNQGIAFGMDALDSKLGAENRWPGRAALLCAALWSNAMLRYYSHEMAHEYLYRNSGSPIRSGPAVDHWTSSYLPGFYYPVWQKSAAAPDAFSEDQLLLAIVAGLNQDEINARTVWRDDLNRQYHDYYNAVSFLLTKFRDDAYILSSGSDERPFAPGQKIDHLAETVFSKNPQLFDDMNLYRLALLNKGVEVTSASLLHRSLAADLLTLKTWQSLYTLFQFIRGESLPENTRMPLPLVSYFLTPNGGFYNLEFPLPLPHNRFLFLDFGVQSADQTAFSPPLRFGAEFSTLHLGSRLELTPFAHWTLNHQIDDGFSIGVNSFWRLRRSLDIWLLLEYHQNDILENTIKGKKQGAEIRFGFCKVIAQK
jgi:hypothetical protein